MKTSQPCHQMSPITEVNFHKEAVELSAEEVPVTHRPTRDRLHVFSAKQTISSETAPIKRRRSPKDIEEHAPAVDIELRNTPRCRAVNGRLMQNCSVIAAREEATARKNARRSSTTPRLPRPKPTSENTTSGKSKTRIEID